MQVVSTIKPLLTLLAIHLPILTVFSFIAASGFSCPWTCCFHCLQCLPSPRSSAGGSSNITSFYMWPFWIVSTPVGLSLTHIAHPWYPVGLFLCTQSALLCFPQCISCYFKGMNCVLSHVSIPNKWGKVKMCACNRCILVCLVNRTVWTTGEMVHFSHNIAITNFWRISPCEVPGEFWKNLTVIIAKLLFMGKLIESLMKSVTVFVSEITSWRFFYLSQQMNIYEIFLYIFFLYISSRLKIYSGEMLTFFFHHLSSHWLTYLLVIFH